MRSPQCNSGSSWLKNERWYALFACLMPAILIGCGGGSAVQSSETPSPTISSVSVACNPSMVATSAASQCTANVQGTGSYSSAVTWTAGAGSINSSGLFTAPASAGSVTVTATSTQDSTKSGTAPVNVQASAPTIKSLAVSCNPATINAN
jgi:hypothetical protein